MTTAYPRECARCRRAKPPWFRYCSDCYAIVQAEQLSPNTCDQQDCAEPIRDEHFLCREHWGQARNGVISECPECGEYKPAQFRLCRRCNTENAPPSRTRSRQGPSVASTAQRMVSNARRPYDQHDGADDQKAKDKRYWFNRQDNGICNYCGHRYRYDQLQMEHMIPKELGGPDHRRNMQLTCPTCNRKKGTLTDMEFRALNHPTLPAEEGTPSRHPIAPEKLKSSETGPRYRNDRPTEGQPRAARPTERSRYTPRRRGR